MDLGFPEHTARDIIRQAKKLATNEYNERIMNISQKSKKMIEYPCSPFDNPRVGVAPTTIVESQEKGFRKRVEKLNLVNLLQI